MNGIMGTFVCRYMMAEILPIRRKTLFNESILFTRKIRSIEIQS